MITIARLDVDVFYNTKSLLGLGFPVAILAYLFIMLVNDMGYEHPIFTSIMCTVFIGLTMFVLSHV